MVPVRKVTDQFEARVIAARLGASGFVTELRGGGIEGPYPMGPIEVLVSEDDLESAKELLLADEVESAFDDDEPGSPPSVLKAAAAAMVVVLLLLVLTAKLMSLRG